MNKIVVIIPVHEIANNTKELLSRAIESVKEGIEVRISCAHGLSEDLKDIQEKYKVVFYEDSNADAKSDFATLINQATENSEYFSILEFEDIYTPLWFNEAEKVITKNPDLSVILPMEDLIDYESKKFIGFGNEAPWASSFSNEIGYIDEDCLQQFFDFYLTGGIFNTKDWEENGGLKSSIKVSFWYEFLLRLTHNGKKVYVVPKIGYTHYVNRPSSLFVTYRDTMDSKETAWWYELAKREYFFKKDRNKQYENNEEGEE